MDLMELMKERHSVRQYTDRPIEAEKREVINRHVEEINQESGLHIQVLYDEPKCFDSFIAHYGSFQNVKNYIAVIGKDAEIGGYYGEKLILQCQALGLNTCWVAMSHGRSRAKVGKGEKLISLIAVGYGVTAGSPRFSRRIEELSTADVPTDWFINGMKAVCLAPTAMNQQKFWFELKDGVVTAKEIKGLYTKIDLGIAKYHFEAISGHKVQ